MSTEPQEPSLEEMFRASWDASSGDDMASHAARQSLLASPGAPRDIQAADGDPTTEAGGVWAVIDYVWDHVNVAVFPTEQAANEWIATQDYSPHPPAVAEFLEWGPLT